MNTQITTSNRLVLLLAIVCVVGCSRGDLSQSDPNTMHASGADDAKGREYLFLMASDLPATTKTVVRQNLLHLVSDEASAGDVIHVVETPSHRPVATIVVPEGNARVRVRRPEVAAELQKIGKFFKREAQTGRGGTEPCQVNPTEIATTFQSLRRTGGPPRIVVVGNPVYDDLQHAGWTMKNGAVPSDSSLRSSFCPFYSDVSFPSGTELRWLTPTPDWGKDVAHRRAVTRFYQLYVDKLGGRLTRLTNDAVTAFANTEVASLPDVTASDDSYVGMQSAYQSSKQIEGPRFVSQVPVAQEPVLVVSPDSNSSHEASNPTPPTASPESGTTPIPRASSAVPNPVNNQLTMTPQSVPHPRQEQNVSQQVFVEQLIRKAVTNKDRIFIAINWETEGLPRQSSDIDLWIKSRGHTGELNFGNKTKPFAKLYRDVTSSGTVAGDANEFMSWECAEIYHNRLHDLTVWLNAFHTSRPVKIRVIVVWKGQRKEKMLRMETSSGDRAWNAHWRSFSNAWKKVDVSELFE